MLKVVGDKIMVERDPVQETSPSGLILSAELQEKPPHGTVVAVGRGKYDKTGKLVPVGVKVGDRVIFNKFGATGVKSGDKDYLIMKEEDLIGIIE